MRINYRSVRCKSQITVVLLVSVIVTSVLAGIADTSKRDLTEGVMNAEFDMNVVYSKFPYPPWGFTMIQIAIAYFVGKFLEVTVNKTTGYGFKAIPFEDEMRSVLLVCHDLTVFADNLGMFADAKGKKLRKFIKFVKRRDHRDKTFRPVKIVYRDDEESNCESTSQQIRKEIVNQLEMEQLSAAVEFVQWNSGYPAKGYLGHKKEHVGPRFHWFKPRYWFRYKGQEYYSGVVTAGPFYPSKSRVDYEILQRYMQCELNKYQAKEEQ